MTIFRVCGNGDYGVCYVSQHEEISTRAPRFCVAYQAPRAVARDGTHVVAAAAARRAQRRGPDPPGTAPRVPRAGGEKNYKGLPPCDSLNRTYLGLVQRPLESFEI